MSSPDRVEAALALIRRRGCLLITRRPQGAHLAGLWEFPGGKCRPGESPEECAVREAMEEVGVSCRALRVRPVIDFDYPARSVRLHPVECEYLGGPPRPLQVADWAWVLPEALRRYDFPPANAPLLDELTLAI